MSSFTNTFEIARPIGDVFDYLEDFTNIPQWNYWVERVERISHGPIGVGTVFHQTRRDDQQRYQLTVHQRPHTLTVATLPGQRPAFTRTLQLEPHGDATVLVDTWQLDSGHPRLVQRIATGRVRQAVAANLDCLKQLLEQGKTVHPDGRNVRLHPPRETRTLEHLGRRRYVAVLHTEEDVEVRSDDDRDDETSHGTRRLPRTVQRRDCRVACEASRAKYREENAGPSTYDAKSAPVEQPYTACSRTSG